MPEVFSLGTRIVNTYLIRPGEHTVLVDTGYPGGYPAFRKRLAAHGRTPDQIERVFLTHAHDDHAGFLCDVLRDTPATVILHEKALPALLGGRNSFHGGSTGRAALAAGLLIRLMGHGAHRFPPLPEDWLSRLSIVTPDTCAALEADLGARILETPGHTACSISLLTPDGLLFCGDAAMNGFPSFRRVTVWAEDLAAYRRSWDAILAAEPRLIYPGHGRPFPPEDLRRYARSPLRRSLYPPPMPKD